MPRARTTVLAVIAATVALMAGGLSARAQLPLPTTTPPPSSTTTTTAKPTTTTAKPATTTTTTRPATTTTSTTAFTFGPTSSTTSTTSPYGGPPTTILPNGARTAATTTSTVPSATPVPGDVAADSGVADTGAIPAQYAGYAAQVRRSSPNNTAKLMAGIQSLEDLGYSEQEAAALTFGHFPVAGQASFVDDWWFPRFNIPFHLHQGTDIFAALGVPVRAPADGTLKQTNGGLGGMAAYVYTALGTYFYMAHLSAFATGQQTGQAVRMGDIVGYVGNTGDAAGGPTHVHFEVHMDPAKNPYLRPPAPAPVVVGKGKKARVVQPPAPGPVIVGDIHDPVLYGHGVLPATDPKPFLDQWLAEDLAALPAIVARAEAGRPRAVIATGLTRRFADGRAGEFAAPTGPPRSQLLWAASASPSGGPLRLAEAEAAAAAAEVDYDRLAHAQAARLEEWAQATAWAKAVLDPLTPAPLRRP